MATNMIWCNTRLLSYRTFTIWSDISAGVLGT